MPRKVRGGPTRAVNIKMPEPLLDDVAELLRDGDAPYSDRSDFIKGAVRKEVDYLRAKKADRILTSEG